MSLSDSSFCPFFFLSEYMADICFLLIEGYGSVFRYCGDFLFGNVPLCRCQEVPGCEPAFGFNQKTSVGHEGKV